MRHLHRAGFPVLKGCFVVCFLLIFSQLKLLLSSLLILPPPQAEATGKGTMGSYEKGQPLYKKINFSHTNPLLNRSAQRLVCGGIAKNNREPDSHKMMRIVLFGSLNIECITVDRSRDWKRKISPNESSGTFDLEESFGAQD